MGNFDKINALPDCMEPSDLRVFFIEVLNDDRKNTYSKLEIAKALWELSDRQWHTYKLIDNELKILLVDWVTRSWDLLPLDKLHYIIGICSMLGIREGLELLDKTIGKISDQALKEKFAQKRIHLAKKVTDPFFTLKE